MAAVGGRMEVVAPKRSLFAPDYLRLMALALVSLAIHVWLLTHTTVTARDSIGFARYALNIQSPSAVPGGEDRLRNKVDVVRAAEQPPGYPLTVWVAAKFVRRTTDLPLPESTLLGAQFASSIAAVFLVIPTYLIGRMLFGRSVGFAAALLFQVLPVPAHLTSDGLSESVYLLTAATGIMLGVRAVRRPGVGGFLACGLAVGCCYLVRPEGLLVAVAPGAVALWLGVIRRWPRDQALGRIAALAVGVALVAVPYMLLIGGVTNKPTGDQLLTPDDNPRAKLWKQGLGPKPAAGGPLFAKWMSPPIEGTAARAVWGMQAVFEETVQSLHYAVAALALFGVFILRRRIAVEPGVWVPLVLAVLNAALLVYLAIRVGYVSERHTVLLVLIGCLFAAAALEPLVALLASLPAVGRLWAGKYAATGLLFVLVAAALPSALKPLHTNREGHKHAGRWLGEKLLEHDAKREPVVVIDPFEWAQWYAGWSLYYVRPDPEDAKVIYSIVENNAATPHSRLPRLDLAKDVSKAGTLVYHWPEDVPAAEAKVHVYKTVRQP